MNIIKNAAVGLAALSIVAAPVAASASPQADLRADTAVEGNEFGEMMGGSWLLGLIGLVAVGVGIYLLVDDGDNSPSSP
jgi:hypothetical protein